MKTTPRMSYTIGFLGSVVLTLVAYAAVVGQIVSGTTLIVAILTLALVQLLIQMVFFLHLGDTEQRWNLMTYLSTVGLVLLIVAGSIWIMTHLNERMMNSPELMHSYIEDQQSF